MVVGGGEGLGGLGGSRGPRRGLLLLLVVAGVHPWRGHLDLPHTRNVLPSIA